MRKLIADYIVKPFKAFPYLGRFRFWCLYWAYRLTGWHIRHLEWDFVLGYLPSLNKKYQDVYLLDVGCSRNLLCHELVARNYALSGIDLETPEFKYPGTFQKADITENWIFQGVYDFVTCVSVLEHVYDGDTEKQKKSIENMIGFLKRGGRLLLTIPTHEFAQGHPWHGFNMSDVIRMLPANAMICEYTERAGQLCLSIERTS